MHAKFEIPYLNMRGLWDCCADSGTLEWNYCIANGIAACTDPQWDYSMGRWTIVSRVTGPLHGFGRQSSKFQVLDKLVKKSRVSHSPASHHM